MEISCNHSDFLSARCHLCAPICKLQKYLCFIYIYYFNEANLIKRINKVSLRPSSIQKRRKKKKQNITRRTRIPLKLAKWSWLHLKITSAVTNFLLTECQDDISCKQFPTLIHFISLFSGYTCLDHNYFYFVCHLCIAMW